MKKLSFLVSLFFSVFSIAQVQWMSLDQAIISQKENPKKILINFYTTDCEACDRLSTITFMNPEIISIINDNFYAVKFDVHEKQNFKALGREFKSNEGQNGKNSYHEFSKYLNVVSAPSLVLLDEKMNFITKLQGFFSPKELEPYLSGIANNRHQKITNKEDWLNYQKKYRSKRK